MTDDYLTVRDAKFFSFAEALATRARWVRQNLAPGTSVSINAELGYGGARLMDVRWTGPKSISKLCDCLYYCNRDIKLRVVGCSAGNIIAYSLGVLLGLKGRCCGYDVKNPKKNGNNIRRDLFFQASGLKIPDSMDCACECVRLIADLLLEVVAVQEHPSWHKNNDDDHDQESLRPNFNHKLSTDIIKEMFEGKKTAESILVFSQGTAASGFSDLYVEAPIQYLLNTFRAIDGLEGRLGVFYLLSRFLIICCTDWKCGEDYINPFFERCELYIGARKNTGDEGFVFSDLVGTQSVPLISLDNLSNLKEDVDRFNKSVDLLMESIDVREIVFPRLAQVVWQRRIKRLRLKENNTLLKNWKWNGQLSTVRFYSNTDFEVVNHRQNTVDIMTNNANGYLPDFEMMVLLLKAPEKTLCWNYVFEISPLGKHLFNLERVSGHFEASLPNLTPWQLKVTQTKKGRKMAVYTPRVSVTD